ncbi:hypothetical protein ACTOB_007925 [Actinoplanes oblitus]|uniref:Uncharacterized protein n=1 Tax=Actinoplanes oblitus TaxID=3040509 RepID=A0ABY8WFA1_9ACTN|nr:hypothetical protein [Actinoplanes oblitus]WIM95791.1 hypothetical protein ACTOB_007925 [Actinoplanes oblitus]
MNDDQRRDHFRGLAQDYARRYAQLVIDALGGQVSSNAAAVLHRMGFELGHDACQILANEIRPRVAPASVDDRPTVTITREQVECWAGRTLTDDEVYVLDGCIPNSSIPDAVGDIVASFPEDSDDE